MYKVEESALELFNDKMFESFLRNLTYENYKKYPLVNMNYKYQLKSKHVFITKTL